jgi:hypothetical protein
MKTPKALLVFLLLSFGLQAQYSKSKLTVAKNDVLEISESDVDIDTLIMGDKSRIVFLALETKLVIRNAFIGENCIWDASGKSTMRASQREAGTNKSYRADGFPGHHLYATVVMFQSLGELEIDAHGTQGRRGRSPEFINAKGSDPERGGDGGDGGIVSLIYGTAGFPIAFNEGGVHSINVNLSGGRGGIGGAPPRTTSGFGNARLPISSHNAAWNQSGIPKSTNASGEKAADLPQPVLTSYLGGIANVSYSRTPAPGSWGRSGRPGRDGRLVLQKLD